jgi:hypothetical protein
VARVEREAAAWGTCTHQISEACLHGSLDAASFIGETQTCGRFTFTVNEEMANCAQVYLDYCRSLMKPGDLWWIEEKLPLDKLKPPFEAGGTGDFIVYRRKEKLLEIVDLKTGRGVVVDAAENAQARSYALGAMLAHQGLDIDHVKTTIVQPRIEHRDGIIRSDTFHVVDLLEWTTELLKGMRLSAEALDALGEANGNQVLLDEWRDKYLKPGKCQFCPAEGVCPALRNDAMSIVDKWFVTDPDTSEMTKSNAALDTSPEALAHDLDLMDELQNWMNARRAYAQQLAESGVAIPNYQLVDKRGTRKWVSDDEDDMANNLALTLSVDKAKLFARKLMSPAQVEKLIPAKQKKSIEPLWHMHVSGTNLVRSDRTTRPAVGNLAERFFVTDAKEK